MLNVTVVWFSHHCGCCSAAEIENNIFLMLVVCYKISSCKQTFTGTREGMTSVT